MPQPGERKTVGGVTGEWDGQTWRQVSDGASSGPASSGPSSLLDYIPGLRDVLNLPSNLVKGAQALPDVVRNTVAQPAATAKGFVQGASDAATPGRVGLLALLTGGATLPATLAAMGGEAAAQGGQMATGSPNRPKSMGDFVGREVGAGAGPGLPAAGGAAWNAAKGALGDSSGLVDGALELGSKIPGLKTVSRLGKVARAAIGGAADDAGAEVTPQGGFGGQPKSTYINRPDAPYTGGGTPALEPHPVSFDTPTDRFAPNTSGYTADAPAGDAAMPFESLVDQFMPNVSTAAGDGSVASSRVPYASGPSSTGGGSPVVSRLVKGGQPRVESVLNDIVDSLRGGAEDSPVGDTPSVRSVDRGNWKDDLFGPEGAKTGFDWPEAGGRYEPDAIGSHVLVGDTPSATAPDPEAAAYNIERSAPYGEGHILPSTLPSELRPASLEGLNAPQTGPVHDVGFYGLPSPPKGMSVDVLGDAAPDVSGQVEPTHGDVDNLVGDLVQRGPAQAENTPAASLQLPESWQALSGKPAAAAGSPRLDSLDAVDDMFGPGKTDSAGNPFQSTSGYKGANNLTYDPQTPTPYLREQYLSATDPADQDFLGRALRQRLRLGQSSLSVPR